MTNRIKPREVFDALKATPQEIRDQLAALARENARRQIEAEQSAFVAALKAKYAKK